MSAARTFAVMAHVDAGKTTLCEQLLLASGALRRAGRVDHGDTALDVDPIERERGITVFSGQAWLAWQGRRLTLIDTPGHVDFASETARALTAADLCVLVVDGTARVDAHTAAPLRPRGGAGPAHAPVSQQNGPAGLFLAGRAPAPPGAPCPADRAHC